MEEIRNAYNNFVGTSKGKRPLGRRRHILEDNIRMDLRETGWEVVDWILPAYNRDQGWALANTLMNLRVT
jgi:hypothetical protein